MSESDLILLVINWVEQNARERGTLNVKVTPDTDLIASGVLDSFALIDLLVIIEEHAQCKIDLTDVEPAEFCVVKGLCRMALAAQSVG